MGGDVGRSGKVVLPSECLVEVLLVSERHVSTTSQGAVGITVYDDPETRVVVDLWCFGSAPMWDFRITSAGISLRVARIC